MARFLKHSLAASEPGYLGSRRLTLMISQALFALVVAFVGVALLREVPALGWLSFLLAAVMVAGIPGIWLGSEAARWVGFGTNLVLVAGQVASLLARFVQGPFTGTLDPMSWFVLVLVAAQAYLFVDPDTRHLFQRVRERRAERARARAQVA